MARPTTRTKEEQKQNQYKLANEYIKRTHRAYTFKFHRKIDADIIAWLDSRPSTLGYIKELIRRDIVK